jgi:hypothetical protein
VDTGQREQALLVIEEMEKGAEGRDGEGDFLAHGRIAHVTETKIDELGDSRLSGSLAAALEHRSGGVDADHRDAGLGDRNGDSACADAELERGPARAHGLVRVEVDVLDDAGVPAVVERGDRVVWIALALRAHVGIVAARVGRYRFGVVPWCSEFVFTRPRPAVGDRC